MTATGRTEASSYERQAIVLRFRYHMIPFYSNYIFVFSVFWYHLIPKRFDFSFDTKRTFLFSYDTGSKLTCDSVFSLVLFFWADSSLSKVTVLYDRQCKIKRCPQNGLTAYTIVIYVWPSERFCGQSVHGNFRGEG